MAKIGWVSDYFYPAYQGGAEISNHLFIEAGRRRGHEVKEVFTMDNDYPTDLDFVVAGNTVFLSEPKMQWLLRQRFVTRIHDIRGLPHYPVLFDRAEATFFLSPLHELVFRERYKLANPVLVPNTLLHIDRFKPLRKKHRAVYLGALTVGKGALNIIEYAWQHQDLPVHLYGDLRVDLVNKPSSLTYKGVVPHRRIPRILGESEYFIFLLSEPGTFSLSCLEAYFAGCKFITNSYEGMWSWRWPWQDRDEVRKIVEQAPEQFWTVIEGLVAEEDELLGKVEHVEHEPDSTLIPHVQV